MQLKPYHTLVVGLAFFGALASWSSAAQPSASLGADAPTASTSARMGRGRPGGFGFVGALRRDVGLTPEQEDAVRGILAQQREQTAAIRESTDKKIRALLNAEQQKKFDAVVAQFKARRGRPSPRS